MNVFKLFSKVFNRFSSCVGEMFNEYAYQLQKQKKHAKCFLPEEDQRFITLNCQHWGNKPFFQKGAVLVEGFFAGSGHNYLMRTGMLAKAIQEQTNADIMVIFDKPANKQIPEIKKYQSFGINRFLNIRPGFSALIHYCKALAMGLKYYLSLHEIDDVLKLEHNGILMGDLIYDDILKCEKNTYTINALDFKIARKIIASFYYYYWYLHFFNKESIQYLIVTHLVYAQYGILGRLALRLNVDVIETNDLMINYLKSEKYINHLIGPTYHSILKERIKEYLLMTPSNENLIEEAEKTLYSRIMGNVDQFDARLAYRNKIQFSMTQLRRELNINVDCSRPLVVIFAHVFADAPHSSERLLFRDYYHWLEQTLACVAMLPTINWLIKPHPAGKVYSEQGVVEKLVNEARTNARADNLFLFPEAATTANINDWAQAIVTVQGTAGIEFSCFGLPVILAGKAFYSGEGFTHDPSSKEEYYALLSNIATLPRLTSDQVNKAKKIYAAFMHVMSVQSQIIPSQALDAIWGYGNEKQPNIPLGNKMINDLLEQHSPKNELQYLRLKEYLG